MNLVCPQNAKLIKEFVTEKLVMDEDCLVANVFVPNTPEENLPVLVYVHGGAFSMGYGNRNKGTQIMKSKNFIMVTFNYRLGVYGFLCLGTNDIPGNAGMKDQVALLRWVQQNIARFGGNPKAVTLAGSSSGSASVDLIMLSKLAKGLFKRVIPESGGSLAAFAVQRDPLDIAVYHAIKLNFTKAHDIFELEKFYKTASFKLLTSKSNFDRTDATFLFSPCVEVETEGAFLTQSPLSILNSGNYTKVPILYGFTRMEGMLRIDYFNIWKHRMFEKFSDFLPADLKFDSDKERLNVAETIKLFYFGKKPIGDDTVMEFIDYNSDIIVNYAMLRAVMLHVKAGHKQVYLYEYSFKNGDVILHSNMRSSDHCAQSKAWLDNTDGRNERYEPRNYQDMRKIVRRIWRNFITTG